MPEPVRHPPPEVGLSTAEAASRLARDGANELAGSRHMGLGRIAWVVVRQPMFLLLLACSALYFALGDRAEAVFLLISVVAVVGLALFQQRRTQRALEALRDAWRQKRVRMDELWRAAELCRVSNVMRPYLESLA